MSKILWGIGHLVEDPSNTIIYSLKKHIFNCEPDTASETQITSANVQQEKTEKNVSRSLLPEASYSKSAKSILAKSKSVQFGTGLVKRRNFSTQCSKFPLAKVCRTTSVPALAYKDKSAATTIIEKKHVSTEPHKLHACEEHQQALKLLRKWPTVEPVLDRERKKLSKGSYLKKYLSELLELVKLEKIQSVPQYKGSDGMKLYRNASIEDAHTLYLTQHRLYKK